MAQNIEEFIRIIFNNQRWLCLVLVVMTFSVLLPAPGYYQTLQLKWYKPKFQELPLSIPNPSYYPKSLEKKAPELTAASAIVIDVDSFVVLYQKEPTRRLSPASTTKIMTGIVALENYKLSYNVIIRNFDPTGSQMGLKIGDKVSIEDLMYGLLLPSGNDAAFVLASLYPGGGEMKFIEAMNNKAKELHMKNTNFVNVSGLEDINHYSTGLDLARLSAYALKNITFAKIVSTPEITLADNRTKEVKTLKSLNKLLGNVLGVTGIKTGWTEDAGECLVASAKRNGHTIISVVLKSADRFSDTEKLLNWAFENYKWEKI